MYIDEKLASMDRLRRENMREESQREQQKETKQLTIEEAIAGIEKGELQLERMPLIEFESFIEPTQKIPFVIFKNFYNAKQENDEGIIFLKRPNEISQILSWPKAEITSTTFEQWGNLLVNGMAANRMYTEIKKKKQLKHIEYICYQVPSGKGPIYNLMFRFREKNYKCLGNYNCMSSDQEVFGIIFEAMMVTLDQWTDASIREAQDGRNKESGSVE